MNFHFTREQLSSFVDNAKREWALTNGIGGYAGGSVLGAREGISHASQLAFEEIYNIALQADVWIHTNEINK